MSPEDALMIGTLKLGALLHGPVAAVEVIVPEPTRTVIWLDRPINPEDALTMGMLKPGALLQGLVPAVEVMIPELMATVI
jgi:hypothetical protein